MKLFYLESLKREGESFLKKLEDDKEKVFKNIEEIYKTSEEIQKQKDWYLDCIEKWKNNVNEVLESLKNYQN